MSELSVEKNVYLLKLLPMRPFSRLSRVFLLGISALSLFMLNSSCKRNSHTTKYGPPIDSYQDQPITKYGVPVDLDDTTTLTKYGAPVPNN
ncbi:MAG: hypothetical protein CVU11_05870 [Bacteroidetes bacterium HGW-Bacteroidetes-6]|jgi:hypothetical protein|nr:MAG: hypothetical protein CVU11_05870 [Bacteroidetes bacterium HGW-Bacteroidetes-6]